MMKGSVPAKRFFFILLGINLLLLCGIAGTFVYASKLASSRSHDIAVLKADVDSGDQAISNYQELEKTIKSSESIDAIAAKVLPQDKEQSVAFAQLNKFSADTGFFIDTTTFVEGGNKTGPSLTAPSSLSGVLVVSANIRGTKATYAQLINFLKKIEDNQRRMQVTSVAITLDNKNPTILSNVDIGLDIYLKP